METFHLEPRKLATWIRLLAKVMAAYMLTPAVDGQTCFPATKSLLPRTWANNHVDYEESGILTIIGDASSIYAGGFMTDKSVQDIEGGTSDPFAVVERTDLAQHVKLWMMAYAGLDGQAYVTGLALGPTIDGV